MPNGGEDKHVRLRAAWAAMRRRYPLALEQFGPEPWDKKTGIITQEAADAYRLSLIHI